MIATIETAENVVPEFRQKHGVTLEKMSEKTGIAKSTLIKIESGKVKPQAMTIFKLNEYLKNFPSE